MMGESMCTPLFHNQFRVPSYEDWVDDEADWSHVYDFHHRQLQHLQCAQPPATAGCSRPAPTCGASTTCCATYPDARIVFTHRDPVKSMTSYASLTTLVRGVGSDSVDPAEVAADWTRRLRNKRSPPPDAVRDGGDYPDATFYDMYFTDFVARPVRRRVRDIYDGSRPPDDRRARAAA